MRNSGQSFQVVYSYKTKIMQTYTTFHKWIYLEAFFMNICVDIMVITLKSVDLHEGTVFQKKTIQCLSCFKPRIPQYAQHL